MGQPQGRSRNELREPACCQEYSPQPARPSWSAGGRRGTKVGHPVLNNHTCRAECKYFCSKPAPRRIRETSYSSKWSHFETYGLIPHMTSLLKNVHLTKRRKRQATFWEKAFTKHITNKGLVSKICKNSLTYNNRRKQFKKRADLIRYSTRGDIRWKIST